VAKAVPGQPLAFNGEYQIPANHNMEMRGIGTALCGSPDGADFELARYMIDGIDAAKAAGATWIGAYGWFPHDRFNNPHCASVLAKLDRYLVPLYIKGPLILPKRWDVGQGYAANGQLKVSHGFADKEYVPVIALNYGAHDDGSGLGILSASDWRNTLDAAFHHYKAKHLFLWAGPEITERSLRVGGHNLWNALRSRGMGETYNT